MFFFEKKNQETFDSWGASVRPYVIKKQKFFASFFQKRSASLSLPEF
jgi:hypothetical protein